MALYKYQQFVKPNENDSNAFDTLHGPSSPTPYSGIYRCEACGHEIVSVSPHPLPPQNHPQHAPGNPIQWRLIVFAQYNE